MGETTPEGAISPVGSASQPEVKKSRFSFPKISLPKLWGGKSQTAIAPDITPAVQATDFVPPAAAIETNSPVNAVAPEFGTPSAQIDTTALDVQKDLTAQMTAQVTSPFPGPRPPEVASEFAAPTNPPTETATVPPIVAGSEILTPTPINAETAIGAPIGSNPAEEKPAA